MAPMLKFLEIEDFKTYLGKNVFGPLHQFTAIVGPNGGGKSNLMDAIAFVLGERVQALRVSRGSELIHREKSSDGASSRTRSTCAAVTAIFEVDGKEVAFKRVVYAASSEFFVEGQRVSLANYLKELEGLGISLQCRNFMVFQGSIETIAMADSKQKTELLEEISGSGELKNEYSTLKKGLDDAEENLKEEFDKHKMIAKQHKDLKEDKKIEKTYNRLKNKCDKEKRDLQLFRLYNIDCEEKKVGKEMETKTAKLNQLKEEVRMKKELMDKMLEEKSVAVQDAVTMENKVNEMSNELRRRNSQLVTVKECLEEKKKKEEMYLKLLNKAKESQNDHLNKIEELNKRLIETDRLVEQYEKDLSDEASRMGTSVQLEGEQLTRYHQLKQEAGQSCASLLQKEDKLVRQLKTQTDQLANEDRQIEDLESALRRKEKEIQEAERKKERLSESISGMIGTLLERKESMKNRQNEIIKKRDKFVQLKGQLETLTEQLSEASWDVSQLEKEKRKAGVVQKLKELYPGVYGRLKNFCHSTHERYKLAITRVLLKHMNSIVVDSVETARECIKCLKKWNMERETFLPLNYLQVPPLRESLRTIEEPQVRLAYDVIDCEIREVKRAVMFVVRDTVVCETPEDAMKVAYEMDKRVSAVALDGTLYTKSGLMSGGKLDLERKAKGWTKKNVEKMETNRDALLRELREARKVEREESEMKIEETQIEAQNTQLKYMSKEKEHISSCITELAQEQNRLTEKLQTHIEKRREFQSAAAEIRVQMSEIKDEIRAKETEIFADFCLEINVPDIQMYEEQGLKVLLEKEDKRLNFQKHKSQILSLMEYEQGREVDDEVEKWEEALRRQGEALKEVKREEKEKIKDVEAYAKVVAEGKAELKVKEKAVHELDKKLSSAQEQGREVRRQKERMEKKMIYTKQKMKSLVDKRLAIFKHCQFKDVELPLIAGSLQHAVRHTPASSSSDNVDGGQGSQSTEHSKDTEVEVDFSVMPKEYTNLRSEEQRDKVEEDIVTVINNLENTLAGMMPPSKNTTEDLLHVTQQLRALEVTVKEKQEVTRNAKQAFDDVKKRRYRLFMDCFSSVSSKIDHLFKVLYNDQSAQALLETDNQEEPYLGSVIYHCIPPGKRCQTMWNLSGGEKAIASLAFVFTLHSYSPAPFFILDEVDAALDKVNIYKIASYLRRNKESVQILVISHKEELYHKADALFGITSRVVNDYGTSKVYSLDLTSYRERRQQQQQQEQQQEGQSAGITVAEIH